MVWYLIFQSIDINHHFGNFSICRSGSKKWSLTSRCSWWFHTFKVVLFWTATEATEHPKGHDPVHLQCSWFNWLKLTKWIDSVLHGDLCSRSSVLHVWTIDGNAEGPTTPLQLAFGPFLVGPELLDNFRACWMNLGLIVLIVMLLELILGLHGPIWGTVISCATHSLATVKRPSFSSPTKLLILEGGIDYRK